MDLDAIASRPQGQKVPLPSQDDIILLEYQHADNRSWHSGEA